MVESKLALKYLFVAEFSDGTIYEQWPSDEARIADKGSCFTDVLKLQEEKKLVKFSITDGVYTWAVHLDTGLFSINDVPFIASPVQQFADPNIEFRLIYFRENQVSTNVSVEDSEITEVGETIQHLRKFFIGWQCTVQEKGKERNYQQLIGII